MVGKRRFLAVLMTLFANACIILASTLSATSSFSSLSISEPTLAPYDRPLFQPKHADLLLQFTSSTCTTTTPPSKTLIVPIASRSEPLSSNIADIVNKAAKDVWSIKTCDPLCQDTFMRTTFDNTSLLWMYEVANDSPHYFYGNFNPIKNEIWKLAALFVYGGVYVSTDVVMKPSLDEIIKHFDSSSTSDNACPDLVLYENLMSSADSFSSTSTNTNQISECYVSKYHLNNEFLRTKYPSYQKAKHFHSLEKNTDRLLFFKGQSISNDIVLARRPGNPFIENVLRNMLEIFKAELLKKSLLHVVKYENNRFQKTILCAAYNVVMYSFIEQLLQENDSGGGGGGSKGVNKYASIKVVDQSKDVILYQSNPVVHLLYTDTRSNKQAAHNHKLGDNFHLVKYNRHHSGDNDVIGSFLEKYDNQLVQGDGSQDIYFISNGKKRHITSFEVFAHLKFDLANVVKVKSNTLSNAPLGDPITMSTTAASISPHTHVIDPTAVDTSSTKLPKDDATGKVTTRTDGRPFAPSLITTSPTVNPTTSPTRSPTLRYNDPHVITSGGTGKYTMMTDKSQYSDSLRKLVKIRDSLIDKDYPCFGDDYAGSRDDFIKHVWKDTIHETPVMVYPLCIRTFQLGNTLGYLLNDMACANVSGAHFIAFHKQVNILDMSALLRTAADNKGKTDGDSSFNEQLSIYSFFQSLPDLIENPEAKLRSDVVKAMKEKCDCLNYCWENRKAPWLKNIPMVADIVNNAIQAYLTTGKIDIYESKLKLNAGTDMLFLPNPAYINRIAAYVEKFNSGHFKDLSIKAGSISLSDSLPWPSAGKVSNNKFPFILVDQPTLQYLVETDLYDGSDPKINLFKQSLQYLIGKEIVIKDEPFLTKIDSMKAFNLSSAVSADANAAADASSSSSSRIVSKKRPLDAEDVPSMMKTSQIPIQQGGFPSYQYKQIDSGSDLVNRFPLMAPILIQYRCGDNVGFGKTRYGLLPFRAYIVRINEYLRSRKPSEGPMFVNMKESMNYSAVYDSMKDRKLFVPFSIYVIADSPNRNPGPYSSRCAVILEAFAKYLGRYFPLATIAIMRGGDVFLDYARIAYSPLVFCSASTYCLWPSLANKGKVFYPLTPLIAGSDTVKTAANLTRSVEWVTEVEMIKDFKRYRPWYWVLDDLER